MNKRLVLLKYQNFFYGLIIVVIYFIYNKYFYLSHDKYVIQEILESRSINQFGTLLDNSQLSLITTSNGYIKLLFPTIFLTFFTKFGLDAYVSVINYALISMSAFIFIKNLSSNKPNIIIIFFVCFLLSPPLVTVLNYSVEVSLLLFLITIYIFTKNNYFKITSFIFALISSFAAWPILFFCVIKDIITKKNLGFAVIKLVIFMLIVLLVSNGKSENIINSYFPILKPQTHGFYIDIHKQADFVSGVPFLGKIFYNKYIVIFRQVVEETFTHFDWDYLVFHSSSGEFNSNPPTFSIMTIFELPFLIYTLYLVFKKRILHFDFIVILSLSLALYNFNQDINLIFSFFVSFYILQTILIVSKRISFGFLTLLMGLIIVGRLVLIDYSVSELGKYQLFDVYKEMSIYITNSDLPKPLYITDRLGQPHLYTTYFGLNSIDELRSSLENTKSRDSNNYFQPNKVGDIYFTSFIDNANTNFVASHGKGTYIELEGNFSQEKDMYIFNKTFYTSTKPSEPTKLLLHFEK